MVWVSSIEGEPRLHGPGEYRFIYLVEGEIMLGADSGSCHLGPGQALVTPASVEMSVIHNSPLRGYEGCFSIDSLKDASHPVLRSSVPVVHSFWFEDAVFTAALMERMSTASKDRDERFLSSALDLFLTQIKLHQGDSPISERFVGLVFDEANASLGVSEFAGLLGVSPGYLNKAVKEKTHRTAMEWVYLSRLGIAKKLLENPAIPISEVARRAGIEDQSYFSRIFRKYIGKSPSQFRKESMKAR